MRFPGFVGFLLFFAGVISADESASSSSSEPAPKAVFKRPSIPNDAVLAMYFDSAKDIEKLVKSTATKDGVDADLSKYDGQWSVEVPSISAVDGDYSLMLKSEGKHHAIAVDLGHDLKFEKDEFVVQYEVNFNDGLTCGGAYIKLLSASPSLDLNKFHDKTPYTIMFGPDKCGVDAKLHFIFRHVNPISGKIEEKHATKPKSSLDSFFSDKKTHLYTLVIRSDNTFEIFVDQSLISSGSLLNDFTPSVVPPKEIDDPEDKKPADWDDRPQIPDASATKPDDWDEDAPQYIVDEDATMPEGWLENEPKLIADPDAEQPADWDSDTDGDWEAPKVDNPACTSAPGCGKWEKPVIPNPKFKGKWSAPLITNPDYKGEWSPKKISNPEYFEDPTPYKMTPIRALGLELWSMTANIAFDNFYIGTSKKGADDFAEQTWVVKNQAELSADPNAKSVVDVIRETAIENPLVIAGCAAGGLVFIFLIFFCCCRGSSSAPSDAAAARHKKTDDTVPDEEEAEEEDSGAAAAAASPEGDADEGEEEEEGEEANEEEEEEPRSSDAASDEDSKKKNVRQRRRKE